MRMQSLKVENFRALTRLDLDDTRDAVVLAGPNGCGKSCVLDAIRLLKSAYGSYIQDEWQMWLGEFQISANREAGELIGLLQDKQKSLRISATFSLSEEERTYVKGNVAALIEDLFMRQRDPGFKRGAPSLSAKQREDRAQLEMLLTRLVPVIVDELAKPSHIAAIEIRPDGKTSVQENGLLELVFSTYLPQQLGVIDYHGPNRRYDRQRLNTVNLAIEATENQQKQNALYNSAAKYANLKTEMTSAYVRHLLAAKADPTIPEDDSLTNTLKELFTTFFPGKEFLGPKPTREGHLTFLVRLASGAEHDIDDLSSGEKEVVYGYLRLHSSAPKNSMVLIDEPELHLNPRLVSGLAAFYYRHLGATHGNQLWLVSHSDTLIREAVAHPGFAVFHVQPPDVAAGKSQATAVKAKGELERVVIDLVGDLAAYRPGAKIVVFESTEEAAFDVRMTCTLFPHFEQRVNPISAGSKRQVSELYSLLEEARAKGALDAKFFAICDADDEVMPSSTSHRYAWDVYHIENYLLEPSVVRRVLLDAGVTGPLVSSEQSVLDELKVCASDSIDGLVAHRLRVYANRHLVSSVNLGFDPARRDIAVAMAEAIARTNATVQSRIAGDISLTALQGLQSKFEAEYRAALADGTWKRRVRGRDVLKRLVGKHVGGMQYEYLRNLIINRMAESGLQPAGMKDIVDKILNA